MNKSVVIGIIILIVIVAGGLGFKVLSDNGVFSGGSGSNVSAEPVKAEPLNIAVASGYSLGTTEIDGKQVPLLRIPLDTWGGYAALFAANSGTAPNADSAFYKRGGFAVELVPVEGAKAQLDGYATGMYPIIWSTMDSIPMIYDAVRRDRRIVPQVFGIFDWSFGGDGIVVKEGIAAPKDLKGKKILTSGNTPYNFFLLWLLSQSNMAPSDVQMVYIGDGDSALEAFKNDRTIDAWVTWSPFMTDVVNPESPDYVKNSKLLITSRDANQLIADIYMARLDFSREHPEILTAFSEAMMEGTERLANNPEPVYASMANFYKLSGGPAEAKSMIQDVHIANLPENNMFFSVDNPINAFKIFFMAQEYYKNAGSLPADATYEAEAVINTSFLEAIVGKGLFADQTNTVLNSFNKSAAYDIADLENQRVVLTQDVEIFFEAQKVDFDPDDDRAESRKNRELLETISEQMSILGTTVVKLVGHLDTSKVEEFRAQGQQAFIEASAQAKLISKKRAEFIKSLLVERYGADAQRIFTEGKGWDQPIDETDAARNRRVEVRFLSFE